MYLIFLGMTLSLIQLPLDWSAGFLLKAIGAAMCMAGAVELKELCVRQYGSLKYDNDERPPVRISGLGGIALCKYIISIISDNGREKAAMILQKNAVIGVGAALLSAGISALFEFIVKDRTAVGNITACLLGMINTALALRLTAGITAFLEAGNHVTENNKKLQLTDNHTDILRLKDIFNKAALCITVNLLSDIINRLTDVQGIQDVSGMLAFLSKLTAYIMVISFAVRAYSVRQGIVRKNGEYIEKSEEI